MNLNGKTVLITGATDGLGRGIARQLAQPGVTLLLHGRNVERGRALVAEVEQEGATAKFYQADFASLKEVQAIGQKIHAENRNIDLLINNAGVGPGKERALSADGYELVFAVNYMAQVVLTHYLLDSLASSARVVNVASAAQHALDFDDLMQERNYSPPLAYQKSKMAMLIWTFGLAEHVRERGIAVTALHPASMMDTTLVRQAGRTPMTTVEEGVDAVLNLALHKDAADIAGQYFDQKTPTRANEQAYDASARAQLRAATRAAIVAVLPDY